VAAGKEGMMSMVPDRLAAGTGTNALPSWMQSILEAIGPDLRGGRVDAPPQPASPGWIAVLSLTVAAALLLVAAGHGAGRRGEDDLAPLLFWSGVVLMVVPTSLRIAWPTVGRGERFVLLLLFAEGLFGWKVVYSPTSFVQYDEFLHWIAVDDLRTARRLFLSNPLLPVGPIYPALEILTTAIVDLTGLSLFAAGTLLLAVLKGTFVGALFLLYERISGSPRMSAIACLVYMACPTFVLFESAFSYESLGIVFCALIFAVEAESKDLADGARLKPCGLIALLLACLTVTHHLAAAYAAIYLAALAVLEVLRRGASRRELGIAVGLAVLAVALPVLWTRAWGDALAHYLWPVIETGINSLFQKLHGTGAEAIGAPTEPIGMRLTTLAGILLLSLGCATGFFRSLATTASRGAQPGWRAIRGLLERRWRDSRVVLLTFLAFGFPISVAFRLTISGWEIGNRMGTFTFFGVALVVAVSVVHFWQGSAARGWRLVAPALALAVVVLGGVTSSTLNPIHGRYRVGGDQESIELMAMETALWTREWLGPGNRFVADRINRLLLASYGRQDARAFVADGVTASRVYEAEELPPDDLYSLTRSDLDFLLVDMRLSMALPVLGFYFQPWETNAAAPLSPSALLKFDRIEGVGRIYDNGWMKIYDVRGLHER
jgi:hypothetical protein